MDFFLAAEICKDFCLIKFYDDKTTSSCKKFTVVEFSISVKISGAFLQICLSTLKNLSIQPFFFCFRDYIDRGLKNVEEELARGGISSTTVQQSSTAQYTMNTQARTGSVLLLCTLKTGSLPPSTVRTGSELCTFKTGSDVLFWTTAAFLH